MSRVLAIFGPTASGKTDVAEAIADRIPAEVVSADAMQAYRGLPILTNQSERSTALVGVWPLSHDGSLAEYQELAHRAVDGSLAHSAEEEISEIDLVQDHLHDDVAAFVYDRLKRRPMILPVVVEV